MYVLNTEITVNFIIAPEDPVLENTDFAIIRRAPDGTTTFTKPGLTTFVTATETVQGSGTYVHTPDQLGRWKYQLVTGTAAAYDVVSNLFLFVVTPLVTMDQDVMSRTIYTTFGTNYTP
jgi:hypothetical protein